MTLACQEWIERLGEDSPHQEAALTELRKLLLTRLRGSFHDRPDLNSAMLEDIVQDSLLKILNKLDSFEGRSQFTTWATTIAVRTAFSELRKRRWRDVSLEQVLDQSGQTVNLAARPAQTPEQADERTQMIKAMYEAIDAGLTAKQREALLAELSGMPLEEIARRTGSNRNAIYKLTHDARKRLKSRLEAAGYASADWNAMRS